MGMRRRRKAKNEPVNPKRKDSSMPHPINDGFSYPTDPPLARLRELVELYRSGELVTERASTVKHALAIQCYAAGQVFGDPDADVVFGALPANALPDAEVADETMFAIVDDQQYAPGVRGALAIPWGTVWAWTKKVLCQTDF